MEDFAVSGRVDVLNLASRKAEEAALRRYKAAYWLDCLVGPLGIPNQPSEKEFISCLRNGLVLCNIINKIQPGSVPKIIEMCSSTTTMSLQWDSQPLPAYQYFENIRNFLLTVQELKLPVFEASVFERDNLEEGSSKKVVDCILALKDYHEWKQMTGGNGLYKPPRSPLHSACRIHTRAPSAVTSDSSWRSDMSNKSNKPMLSDSEIRNLEDTIVKAISEHMVDTKENMDGRLLHSFRSGNVDLAKLFHKTLIDCLDEQFQKKIPKFKSDLMDNLRERSCSPLNSETSSPSNLLNLSNRKCCRSCLKKGNCNHWNIVQQQERDLLNIKTLLSSARQEFKSLQCQLHSDLKHLGDQVLELAADAHAYQKVVKENRDLYNQVQDLKGNIRVYCRIRPVLRAEVKTTIDFIGEDGSLVIVDPLKPHKDGKKTFQFNRVFGPKSSQDDVYHDIQPLITSVMDGYNVCIFAYGQTGSGKTHTMCGPFNGSDKELGVCYLALNDLFKLHERRKDVTKYRIQVQMVEIYNEQVRDLLAQDSCNTKLEIRSCVRENGLSLPDATLHSVKSTSDVINLMKLGEKNRAVGSTAMNISSSRSHSIVTVHVHGRDASGSQLQSCLHLVDLAGSERIDKSEVTGDALKEAQYINKSLSCLGDVITALAQKNSHIPYRNSKLTLLLQNSLGGNAKTLMFAHANPQADSYGETLSTLNFAQRVSTVELGAAHANRESHEVLELKEQIENLKKALAASKEVRSPLAVKSPLSRQITRRSSIENSSALARSMNCNDKREAKTPSVKLGSKRLSLEKPRNAQKDSNQTKSPKAITSSQHYNQPECEILAVPLLDLSTKKHPIQVPKSPISTLRSPVQVPKSPIYAPRSPMQIPKTSISQAPKRSPLRSPVLKIDTATLFQLPKTPDPITEPRKENDHVFSSSIKTPSYSNARGGKGSQIKKSLLSISKFINGSEKRKQPETAAAAAPFSNTITTNDAKSPATSNARALRRRSLASIQPPERSRRSSLGGVVPTDSYGEENVNSKTPTPQVSSSTKLSKRRI